MISAYSGTAVRAAEQPLLDAGAGPDLMQKAAYGLYHAASGLLSSRRGRIYGSKTVVLAGAGNNGGDALYAASRLLARGGSSTAVLTAADVHPAALAAFRRRGGKVLTLTEENTGTVLELCRASDLVLDGILGTGGKGGLRSPAAGLAVLEPARLRRGEAPAVVACDLPSGINADTGEARGAYLRADLTVTFGAPKAGLMAGPGAAAAGQIECVDIGLSPQLRTAGIQRLEDADIADLLRPPAPGDHKYSRGVLGIAAGSTKYPGAAVLATGAALATGVGMVRFLGPEPVCQLINLLHPEAVCSQGGVAQAHVQAWAAGPGAGEDEGQLRRAVDAMASGLPAVIDADAIAAAGPGLGPQVILTPHAGELTALLNSLGNRTDRAAVEGDPLSHVRHAADLTGATVLLKGWATLVAAPGGPVYSQAEATPWLATAGSGDTLSGILGALLATDTSGPGSPGHYARLAAAAASIHGRAGTLSARGGPVEASGLPASVRRVLAGFLQD
ncbi:bifunctional ADP-dependent NAD(P)H-hydrate dehydratase/NAD(P)H-hydrate epimerase [Arthrobacter sp. Sa2BUA2]|uniref:Bifunctional NAD(P)H-hydrate repair enzyme n=1 Tax=Arthrobacter pullicola TaxID=2762224 RepID=A0ABR8YIJ9_9MICC|nr:bifunctional ADP-dependent NAD(P)H-hydrate dehydratase/NAD(P)H-hydrate epimerase [Arthrobacter pullicola]MBD8044032.1 bifunctional ADP-dependent NAD(P)H-hydrate dehydratase/NAD(P)H-hydrate epimerase [Arthrobacter pullicola]